jgi:putative DNA methylase
MTKPYKKKLIEVALPLEAINAASSKEKSIRHGHPSTLHLWWARRPLAACRAVLFAQLVDDPSEYVDRLLKDPLLRQAAEAELNARSKLWEKRQADVNSSEDAMLNPSLEECAADIERKRLFAIIEELVKWENSTNDEVIERARAEIKRSCGDRLPPVYDPFSGGGSIPHESQRLGLPTYGSDLNPVAVMIGKAMTEIPRQFKDQSPIHPGTKERNHYRNTEGLAEDVKYYGEWMRERAYQRIGHLYPKVHLPDKLGGGGATVIAWLWARTVPSPDPAFADAQVPLVSSFLLSSKKGKEAWVDPQVDKESKSIRFEIRYGGTKGQIAQAKLGTKSGRGASFTCLLSETAITPDHVTSSGKSGQMGQMLMAIVATTDAGRVYVAPTSEHERIAFSAKPAWKPEQRQPDNPRWFSPPAYGMSTFGDLFTDRQLVTLNTFVDLVNEARQQVEQDALESGLPDDAKRVRHGGNSAIAYANAVSVYLGFGVTDYQTSKTRFVDGNLRRRKFETYLADRQSLCYGILVRIILLQTLRVTTEQV